LVGFVSAHLVSNLLLWYFYHILVSHFYARIRLRIDVSLWKSLMIAALPMGGGVMLRQLALQLDILILTWMTNLTTVGLFSGPYRISMALRVIPQTLSLPLYPLYSRTAHLSPERFREAYQWSMKFFALFLSRGPNRSFGWLWAISFCPPFPRCSFSALGWSRSFSRLCFSTSSQRSISRGAFS
jgi:O-antigen/teichoic acid export membrane protein